VISNRAGRRQVKLIVGGVKTFHLASRFEIRHFCARTLGRIQVWVTG